MNIKWFSLITALGVIIAVFLSPYYNNSFFPVLLVSQIITQIIGITSVLLGAFFYKYYQQNNKLQLFFFSSLVALGAFFSSMIAYFIINLPIEFLTQINPFQNTIDFLWKVSLPGFFIAFTINAGKILIKQADKQDKKTSPMAEKTPVNSLSFRSEGEFRIIPYIDIIYISANNMKTVIHTGSADYSSDHLLKDIAKKLPENNFLRVHKRFIINLSLINRVQYLAGGSYLMHLADEDDTTVTVGRTYVPLLKSRLNLS